MRLTRLLPYLSFIYLRVHSRSIPQPEPSSPPLPEFITTEGRLAKLTNLRESCGENLLVVNVHVPKTAGTVVARALGACAEQLGKKFAYGHTVNFLKMNPLDQANVVAADSHWGYGLHLQPEFPQHRRNCTVYTTMVRPLVETIWSAYRFHINQDNITNIADYTRSFFYGNQPWAHNNPWTYQGSVSSQFCCFSDVQHPAGSTYDDEGHLISSAKYRNGDPKNCPETYVQRAKCATHHLCNDFQIIGDVTDDVSVGGFYSDLETLMECNLSQFKPDGTKARTNVGEDSPSFTTSMGLHLAHMLQGEGAATDSAVVEFARKLARGDYTGCVEGKSSHTVL